MGNVTSISEKAVLMILCTLLPLMSSLKATVPVINGVADGSKIVHTFAASSDLYCLHFKDGSINHNGYGHKWYTGTIDNHPLNEAVSQVPTNYTIISADDPVYTNGKNPVAVYRKTKGTDWMWIPSYIKDHWIYLKLPSPLVQGKTYTIRLNADLNTSNSEVTFVFDVFKHRSESIRVNHIGYLPGAEQKFAYVSAWAGDGGAVDFSDLQGRDFYLVEQGTATPLLTGQVEKRVDRTLYETEVHGNNFSRSDVYECNFSAFKSEGGNKRYVIVIKDFGCSYPFRISVNVYDDLKYHCTRAIYHQRMGIALEPKYTAWHRPVNYHPDRLVNGKPFAVRYGSKDGPERPDIWGWYADAGDNDSYTTHLLVPKTLMLTYELTPDKYRDSELSIPESGNGIPDILDEAGWLVKFCKRAKGPTGGVVLRVANGRPDGGTPNAPGKAGVPTWEDEDVWWTDNENTVDAMGYATLAAQYAYNLRLATGGKNAEVNAEIQSWIEEAKQAYAWATDPANADKKHEERRMGVSTGDRQNALIWLYKATGEKTYHDDFLSTDPLSTLFPETVPGFPTNAIFATWAYLMIDRATLAIDQAIYDQALLATKRWADARVTDAQNKGFRMAMNHPNIVVIGNATTPVLTEVMVAHQLTKDKRYLSTLQTSADFFLGGNPINLCNVTGFGHYSPTNMLKLDWWFGDQVNGRKDIIPGYVLYSQHSDAIKNVTGINDGRMWNTVYPDKALWPIYEGFFNSRYSVMSAEFTVWQNLVQAAAVYSYLSNVEKTPAMAQYVPQEHTSVRDVMANDTLRQDFLIQGDYLSKKGKVVKGLQLIASGGGRFRCLFYDGGLPGDGWYTGDYRLLGTAVVEGENGLRFDLLKAEPKDFVFHSPELPLKVNATRTTTLPKRKQVQGVEQMGLTIEMTINGETYIFQKIHRCSKTINAKPPRGAVVIFDGTNVDQFLPGAKMNVTQEPYGNTLWSEATTKPLERKPYTLHVEFMLSYMPTARGQQRSNSGVYVNESYEFQVLDSYGLELQNNECGALYSLKSSDINMCYPPLTWQTYDIDFIPPEYEDGQKVKPAHLSVRHNGVPIHSSIVVYKNTPFGQPEADKPRGLYLQGHNNKVQYRNIWLKYR